MMDGIEVTLISGRTARQGVGLEEGKTSQGYIQSVSVVSLCPDDAASLGLGKDEPVTVATENGRVVVNWREDKGLARGTVFFPYGPWANQVYASTTDGTGMPQFKGIRATISSATGNKILSIQEIVESMREAKP
jgi:formylmethanofuran dehydrogenase subunit D